MNTDDHNRHIGHVLFGYPDYDSMEDQLENSRETLLAFYIISDAVCIAVDFSKRENNTRKKYDELVKNLKEKNNGISVPIPGYNEFGSLGAGTHRRYNHQGFYYEYEDDPKKNERWKLGRDKLLIPSTRVAFGYEKDEKEVQLIACIAYYTHLFADMIKGETESLFPINEPIPLFHEFWKDVTKIIDGSEINNYKEFLDLKKELKELNEIAKNSKARCIEESLPYIVLVGLAKRCPSLIKKISKTPIIIADQEYKFQLI